MQNTATLFRKSVTPAILALLALLVQGCIPIVDLGEYWAKGTIDPGLAGGWRKIGVQYHEQAQFMSFIRSGDCYLDTLKGNGDPGGSIPPIKTKTLTLGHHTFLMYGDLDKIMTKLIRSGGSLPGTDSLFQGGLQRYTLENGILSIYRLKDGILAKAILAGEVGGRLPRENDKQDFLNVPALATLDEKTVSFLIALADHQADWEEPQRYEHIQDLQKAIDSSLTYPATPATPANTLIKVQIPDLNYFASGGRQQILQRQLEADPNWRVFQDRGGKLVCYQRKSEDGRREASINGFIRGDYPDSFQAKAQFTFADSGARPGGSNQTWLTEVNPMAGDTHLALQATSQGIQSYLTAGQKGLWFEYFEESKKEDRVHTRKALAWLGWFLKGVHVSELEIQSRGYAAALMPPDGVSHGKPSLEASDGMEGGMYDVHGRANPGKAGYAFLKVFNTETGARLSQEDIKKDSNEFTGWSPNPGDLFYYNTDILIVEGEPDHPYGARFELWFHPDDGTAEIKLVTAVRQVSAFQN